MRCTHTLLVTILYHLTSQALKEVTFALTSSFQSSMKHINLLMKVLKSGEYFEIYPRHSIGCDMTVLYSNFRKIASLVNKLLKDFLESRKQGVVLNGQHSSWGTVNAGVPQRSILGPLLFLVYMNDLSNDLPKV